MISEKYKKIYNEILLERSSLGNTLVVDGTNMFIRSAIANELVSETGAHMGGLQGFLMSVGLALKTFKINEVIVVFDGVNGSKRRKEIYPEYKGNRDKNKRITKHILFNDVEEERNALKFQMMRLLDYLRLLPLKIMIINNIEADDVIAYISDKMSNENKQVIIMSTDKDMLQLINKNISVWSPTKKILYNTDNFVDEFGVYPINYILLKILNGDVSDNVAGVYGVGDKTLLKAIPELKGMDRYSTDDLLEFARTYKEKSKLKIYEKLIESESIIKLNYRLMVLPWGDIPETYKTIMDNQLNTKPYEYKKLQFINEAQKDQAIELFKNINTWLSDTWNRVNNSRSII